MLILGKYHGVGLLGDGLGISANTRNRLFLKHFVRPWHRVVRDQHSWQWLSDENSWLRLLHVIMLPNRGL